jgi:hypothetical protein
VIISAHQIENLAMITHVSTVYTARRVLVIFDTRNADYERLTGKQVMRWRRMQIAQF